MNPLRSFGFIFAGLTAGIASILAAMQNTAPSPWVLLAATLISAIALVRPSALRPVHAAWMTLARALAWVNTRLLLGLVFYLVLTPVAIGMRLAGRDALRLKPDPRAGTYGVPRDRRPGDHMRRQF